MENLKHTQGEWQYRIKHARKSTIIQVVLPNKTELNLGTLGEDDCTSSICCMKEEHANAKLIAATPDLLEALIEVEKELRDVYNTVEFEGKFMTRSILDKAINSIKKATE